MRKISLAQKCFIGCVELGQYMMSSIILNALLLFYTDYIGLRQVTIFGTAQLIYGIWNAINDPILGFWSDKKPIDPVKGKRRSLMMIGTPIMFAGFLVAALVPLGASTETIFWMLLIGLIIFDLGKALTMTNYTAYCMQISDDPQERTSLSMVAKYVTFIPGALVGMIPTWFLTGAYSYTEVLTVFLLIVIPMTLISVIALFKMEEPIEMYATSDESKLIAVEMNFMDSVKYTLKSKSFLYFIGYRMAFSFAQACYYQNIIYLMKWVVPTSGIWALLLTGGGGLFINALYPIYLKYRKQYGTVNVLQASLFVSLSGFILMFFANNFWMLLISYALSVFATSSLYLLGNVLLADIADEDMLRTGHNRQGSFASIAGFFTTLSGSIALYFLTLILEVFQYDGTATSQSNFTILGIRIATTIIPIFGVIGAIIILKYYPLQGKKYVELRQKLDNLHLRTQEKLKHTDVSANVYVDAPIASESSIATPIPNDDVKK